MSKRVLIVDVSNILYRNFHALRKTNMRSPSGDPSWAVHGFMLSLAKSVRFVKPDFIVCALDTDSGCPYRRLLAPEYKRHRPIVSGDLKIQLDAIDLLLTEARLVPVKVPLWEADDVIASVAFKAELSGFDSFILTSDRDALQLITNKVNVVSPALDLITPAALLETKQVTPFGYFFLAALRGEPSDGISGVPTIGAKTALVLAQQLQEFHPEDYQNISNVLHDEVFLRKVLSVKQYTSLQNNLPLFYRNMKVAFLNKDLPVGDCFISFDAEIASSACLERGLFKVSEVIRQSLTY